MTNKEVAQTFFGNLWADPPLARSVATDDVTWKTTRSMPIPGADGLEHVGWDAVKHVADSGVELSTGYLPETVEQFDELWLEAEDNHVIYRFSMRCKTRTGGDYLNDYLFLIRLSGGKVAYFEEFWDSKQAFDLLMKPVTA